MTKSLNKLNSQLKETNYNNLKEKVKTIQNSSSQIHKDNIARPNLHQQSMNIGKKAMNSIQVINNSIQKLREKSREREKEKSRDRSRSKGRVDGSQ